MLAKLLDDKPKPEHTPHPLRTQDWKLEASTCVQHQPLLHCYSYDYDAGTNRVANIKCRCENVFAAEVKSRRSRKRNKKKGERLASPRPATARGPAWRETMCFAQCSTPPPRDPRPVPEPKRGLTQYSNTHASTPICVILLQIRHMYVVHVTCCLLYTSPSPRD